MAERVPAMTFPPGEFVKDELEARGWTQSDLAEILGRPPRLVSEIVNGKRTITPETARGLGAAFGTEPQLWLNLETAYQLSLSKAADASVERRARLYGQLPMKEMMRRQWIEESDSVEVLEQRVLSFLGVTNLDETPKLQAVARSSKGRTLPQMAWLLRVRQLGGLVQAGKYERTKADALVAALRSLFADAPAVRHIPRLLAESGIRFVLVESLPKSNIDGACVWLDDSSPVVALSLRSDRVDSLWFTLFHELGHVKNGDGKRDGYVLDVDLVGENAQRTEEKDDAERKADEFASETLIPRSEIDSFIARVRPLYSKARIVGFAKRLNIHPGIVVGRLQYLEEIKWSHSREMLEKVRNVLAPSALTDGWGSHIALAQE
jgi:HTH-type transcriptional regulator / antitoxin HigA